ncbi:kinase-like domain-containing protein, partial [Flagelloscypha sp. PMI_526]
IHEIASGMEYLHSLSICHGDIKGANILVHDDGHCRLADFGIAALIHTHSNTFSTTLGDGSTQMHGSARWAAPEILEGHSKEHTSAQDVYAFACTITEIATGQPPFASEHFTDASVLLAVVQGKRPSRPDVPWLTDDIWGLVQECWAHDPHERPRVSRI